MLLVMHSKPLWGSHSFGKIVQARKARLPCTSSLFPAFWTPQLPGSLLGQHLVLSPQGLRASAFLVPLSPSLFLRTVIPTSTPSA